MPIIDSLSEEKLRALREMGARGDAIREMQIDPSTLSDAELEVLLELHAGGRGTHLFKLEERMKHGHGSQGLSMRIAAIKNANRTP